MRVFLFQKCGKFLSVSLGHIIKHKPHISEECTGMYTYGCRDVSAPAVWSIIGVPETPIGVEIIL